MKRLSVVSLAVVYCLLISERPAHAYMDPGSGSMFVQLVLGGVAGVGLIAKLYWRKLLSLFGVRTAETRAEERQSQN